MCLVLSVWWNLAETRIIVTGWFGLGRVLIATRVGNKRNEYLPKVICVFNSLAE